MEKEEKRIRVVLDQGRVPTKVAVGRDRNEAGVLLLLAPCLVGPVVQVFQVRRALCTELHPGCAEWQLSQWQRAETGMAMRYELLCWCMQALAQPCMWEPMPTYKHMAMRWRVGTPIGLWASRMGVVEGMAVPRSVHQRTHGHAAVCC